MGGTLSPGLRRHPAWRWASKQRSATTRWVNEHRRPNVRSACYAPHAALYFRPDGLVHACCATGFSVGSVTGPQRLTLHEIWQGAELDRQRRALEDGSFDLGCQECEVAIETSGRRFSIAGYFDLWRLRAPLEYPHMMDFALSNRCNLGCVMCNGDLSSTIRKKREGRAPLLPAYDDEFFDELATFIPHLERVQFKGGEPFLAPESKRVWDLMLESGHECDTFIVTNGTVWTPEVEHYVRALKADVSISIDGTTPEVLEAIRVGVDFDQLWTNIERFHALTKSIGRHLTLSYCVMTNNWHQLPDFLTEVEARGLTCNTIMVNQPDEYDLLKLPPEELRSIIGQLEARAPALTMARPIREWEQVLERLRTHLDHPIEWHVAAPPPLPESVPVPVEITRPAPVPEPALEPVDLDAVIGELAAASDATPLEVVIGGGTVRSATDPPWAAGLSPATWVGTEVNGLEQTIAAIVGTTPSIEASGTDRDRVSTWAIRWPDQPDAKDLHAVVVPIDDGTSSGTGLRLLIVPTDSLRAPTAGT